MRPNDARIPVSHGGNLPRPAFLDTLPLAAQREPDAIASALPAAIRGDVERQIDCGIDIVNDGEYLKATQGGNYGSYLFDRVVGFSREQVDRARPPKRDISGARDRPDFPGFYESGLWCSGSGGPVRPGFPTPGPPPTEHAELACTGPLSYTAQDAIAATGGLTAEARSRGARNRPGGAPRAHCTAAGEVCGRRGPGEPGSRHWLRHRLPGWSR
jgi:5-methyltetrahydropteroyltriglutamate--homocysteine methyltransferase